MDNHEWVETMKKTVEKLAKEHGWGLEDGTGHARWQSSSMGSWYTSLTRVVIDSDGDENQQTVNLRVSGHGTAYCTEDVSLVPPDKANPDDHDLANLLAILAGLPVADNGYNPATLPTEGA